MKQNLENMTMTEKIVRLKVFLFMYENYFYDFEDSTFEDPYNLDMSLEQIKDWLEKEDGGEAYDRMIKEVEYAIRAKK